MTIKSLLLGSAAALAVVSGAQAADAIVAAEPEPAEYVKVCDAFGTGYFYIPGTETCLKIGGKLRFQVGGGDLLDTTLIDTATNKVLGHTWGVYSRAQLSVSTASDTEYGALKTSAVLRFNNSNQTDFANTNNIDSDSFDLNEAIISIGGLTVGQTDSLFTTMTGYAGNVINDGSLVGYGPFDTQMVKYSYTMGSITAAGAIEFDGVPTQSYTPDLVVGAAYSGDAGGFSAVMGYDESANAAALKARVDAKSGMISGFFMAGFNTGDVPNRYAPWNGDWAVWGGLSAAVSDSISLNTQIGYDKAQDLEIATNLAFTVASGFKITPEIAYSRAGATKASSWGGMIRFDRDF